MNQHEKLNYVEFPAKNLAKTKAFFSKVFDWKFEDYGPEYSAFNNAGMAGGFYQSDLQATANSGSALLVFYSNDIQKTQVKIEQFEGVIIKPIFDFPGGRRFHFTEPSGNEFAVWGLPVNK